ncbi:MAG: hypothetical protein H7834_07710 [Magnetococcus sp. YQC-9]
MPTRIHPLAGGLAMAIILLFQLSTLTSELFLSHAAIVMVKSWIVNGLWILIPALMATGGSGFHLAKGRMDGLVAIKMARMRLVAANGILILIPCALFLENQASKGAFDAWFYGVQLLELTVGLLQLYLMSRNFRDGLRMAR